MRTWLEHGEVSAADPEPGDVAALVAGGVPFWLDVEDPTDAFIDQLAGRLDLHPLAVEDSKRFAQRGKLAIYGDLALMIGFGIDEATGEPVEVHAYLSRAFLVTIHRERSAALDELHRTGALRTQLGTDPVRVLHAAITALHDPFGPYVESLEDRLSHVERDMVDEPLDRHLVEIASIRQRADALRRTLLPGREAAGRMTVIMSLPGASSDSVPYAADVLDELQLIVADLGAISDRCLGALGLHTSLASNRQNAASRQLAAVATIFLPITFVVGFFGMNFGVLINDFEEGWVAFLVLGIALNIACVLATQWWLRRRGWR